MVPGMHMSKPIVYLNIIHGKRVPTPIFFAEMYIANLNMAKQLAHECHRNTTN